MKNISDGDSYALLNPIKRIINIMKLTFLALFLCVTGLFATEASSQVAEGYDNRTVNPFRGDPFPILKSRLTIISSMTSGILT